MNPTPYPWLDECWAHFTQFGGHLPHAILIDGPAGVGKNALAMAMAQSLLCDSDASHTLFNSGNHPDFHLISTEAMAVASLGLPQKATANKKTNKGSVGSLFDQYATRYLAADAKTASRKPRRIISIDQIRHLIQGFSLAQHTSDRKVALITPAEAMNINASNALLKLLEEPPEDAILILVSNEASRLPVTVVSRCVRMPVSIPDHNQALSWLSGQTDSAEQALALSGGAPLAAQALEAGGGMAEFEGILQSLKGLLDQQLDAVVVAEALQKLDLASTLNQIQHIMSGLLAHRVGAQASGWWAQQLQVLNQSASHLSTESLCAIYDLVSELKRHDVAQLNGQMLFEQITVLFVNKPALNSP